MFSNRSKSVNLELLHEEFELNYRRLNRIMGKTDEVGYSTSYILDEISDGAVSLYVIEVTKYTSLVRISAPKFGPAWLSDIDLKVRVYRDAKMAEVVEWCKDRTIPFVLSEPSHMQSRDEKWQWNVFLSELLSYGLRNSLAKIETSK